MIPQKFDDCVKSVKRQIKSGKTKKTYKKGKVCVVSNPYAICSGSVLKKR